MEFVKAFFANNVFWGLALSRYLFVCHRRVGNAIAFPQKKQDFRHCGLDPQSHKSSLSNKPKAGLLRCNTPRNDVIANEPLTLTLSRKGRGNSSPVKNLLPYYLRALVTSKKCAFTLAEVLITLGIIGVVAALTLPALLANIQGKVRAEQIRTVKYKFTKATDKMKSLSLIGAYPTTNDFVQELRKHLVIAKVCDANHIRDCWPYDTVILQDDKEYDISKTKTGKAFKMPKDNNHDYTNPTVGIVTGDGTAMILSYNSKCDALDPVKSYGWSTEDNKPVTNATTNCVAAVFDINGGNKPNKLSKDVVLFNANGLGSSCAIEIGNKCFGAAFTPTPVTKAECLEMVASGKYGIKACNYNSDYWAGAVKQCGHVNNLPTMSDLAQIASAIYEGNPAISGDKYGLTYKAGTASSMGLPEPSFFLWSGEESSAGSAHGWFFSSTSTRGSNFGRYDSTPAVCLGD